MREKERVEEPHATIVRGKQVWRFGLRSRAFLDVQPDPRHVPQELVEAILGAMDVLREEWDEAYPENRVESEPGEE
jgi:hypothetical protein